MFLAMNVELIFERNDMSITRCCVLVSLMSIDRYDGEKCGRQ